MQIPITDSRENSPRSPWNKRKLIGSNPPLRTKNVWSIRTKLQVERRIRDLAMFNLAIDSILRGCDVVSLTVEDVAPNGVTIDRATVRQKKTGHSVRFELSEQTRESVDAYIRASHKKAGEFLFTSRRYRGRSLTTRQYARLISGWIAGIGLDPALYGTHSLRRTKATLIYRKTGNPPRSLDDRDRRTAARRQRFPAFATPLGGRTNLRLVRKMSSSVQGLRGISGNRSRLAPRRSSEASDKALGHPLKH
jgi:integrase